MGISNAVLISVYLFVSIVIFKSISSKIDMVQWKKNILGGLIGSVALFLYSLHFESSSSAEFFYLAISSILSFAFAKTMADKAKNTYKPFLDQNLANVTDNDGARNLIEKTVALTVFVAPFLFMVNFFMQVLAMVFKGGDASVIAHMGTFGDFLGGTLGPVLMFATFVALLATIVLQLKENKETREELKKSSDAQVSQSEALEKSQFESTFFALLDQHNNALEKLQAAKLTHVSKHVFAAKSLDEAKQKLEENERFSGQYLRVLQQLLKFVDSNATDKQMYADLVRSFVGYEAAQLVAVHAYDDDDYKQLLEEYAFLQQMPFDGAGNQDALLNELAEEYFQPAAFGRTEASVEEVADEQ